MFQYKFLKGILLNLYNPQNCSHRSSRPLNQEHCVGWAASSSPGIALVGRDPGNSLVDPCWCVWMACWVLTGEAGWTRAVSHSPIYGCTASARTWLQPGSGGVSVSLNYSFILCVCGCVCVFARVCLSLLQRLSADSASNSVKWNGLVEWRGREPDGWPCGSVWSPGGPAWHLVPYGSAFSEIQAQSP